MSQFDVHRNAGAQRGVIPFVVIVQSRRFDASSRRVVVPLVDISAISASEPRLNPVFEIEGRMVVLHPLQIVSMPADRLGACVSSLKEAGDQIIAAVDMVLSRSWD